MSKRQLRSFVESATIIAALSLTLTSYSIAATNILIKIDGVPGESQVDKHRDEIDVLSWSWGATQSASSHVGAGAGTGTADFHDVAITKYVDKATPLLVDRVATGKIIKEAHLTVTKVGGKQPVEMVKLHLYDCLISSVSLGTMAANDRMTENITINFGKYKIEYTPQNKDGGPDTAGTTSSSANIAARH